MGKALAAATIIILLAALIGGIKGIAMVSALAVPLAVVLFIIGLALGWFRYWEE